MRLLRRCALLAAVAVAAGILPGAVPAAADPGPPPAADHVVLSGWHDEANPRPYEYTKYYPGVLQVKSGQTVRWDNFGFHTVTFLPGGNGDSRRPVFRGDETPGTAAIDEHVFGINGTPCGFAFSTETEWQAQDPCDVAGPTTAVESTPFEAFRARITAGPGTELTYYCQIHPSMKGKIKVVSGTPVNPTPQQIASEIAADTAKADQLRAANNARTSPVGIDPSGRPIYEVRAGDATAGNEVQILDYMPTNLTVPANAKVRFKIIGDEFHTVTFPKESEGGFTAAAPVGFGFGGLAFNPACDMDGRTQGASGIPYGPCLFFGEDAGDFEVLLAPWMISPQRAPNDTVAPGVVHNSAFLVAAAAPAWAANRPGFSDRFPSEFPASFAAAGTYTYYCALHMSSPDIPVVGDPFPGMQGSITVAR